MMPLPLTPETAQADRGSALVIVLLVSALVGAVAAMLTLQAASDLVLAGSARAAQETLAAADAALERAMGELARLPDWSPLLAAPPGNLMAPFSDMGPLVVAPDGRRLPVAVRIAALDAAGGGGFGADAPRWRLYLNAPMRRLWPGPLAGPPATLAVFVADDGADGDGDAERDSNGRLLMHVDAFGVQGSHRQIEALIERAASPVVRLLTWVEVTS